MIRIYTLGGNERSLPESTWTNNKVPCWCGAIRHLLGGCLIVAATSEAAAQSRAPEITRAAQAAPTRCALPGVSRQSFCGTLRVPENRTRLGRTIPLRVVVIRADSGTRVADAIFILTGGPGSAATEGAAGMARAYTDANARRDLVFVDQRGTGSSNALRCTPPASAQQFLQGIFATNDIAACGRQLAARADLAQYGTANAIEDLEDVRRWLNYPSINLLGQ